MEPLGVFSSAGTTADLCKNLVLLCQNVKNAGAETDQLRRLVTYLQIVFKSVEEMRSSPNNAKLKYTHQLADAIHDIQSLLKELANDLSRDTSHKFPKIKTSSLKWPFEKEDILKRMQSLERGMQIIITGLQIDHTNILLDIDYRSLLDRLPVASNAYFDSFDESRKARCLPETRVDLLQDVSNWANNPDSHAIFWLNGMAGTGKSTISRTISTTFADGNRLGASFFFKRGEADRGGLTKFFTTIAADLAQRQTTFGPRIKKAIDAEPGIITKSALDQFQKLIIGPLSNIPWDSGQRNPIVVVVDALDECDEENDIKLLISLFSRSQQQDFPKFKFFLTSRPELPLRLGFKKIEGTYQDLILHEIPDVIIEHDISTYLEYELSIIRNEYNLLRVDDLRLPEDWPGTTDLEILVKMAVPLFIFASTTCRFIANHRHGGPQRQLQRVLQYKTKATGSRLDPTYLPILDQQLDGLSDREKNEVAEEFRAIIGTIIMLANPLSIIALSRMLEISKDTIADRLDMLHSVMSVPPSLNTPVRMLHLSFRDFLLDPDTRNKTPLWIDERQAHAKMADQCMRLLDNLKSDICNLKIPSISTVDISRETIDAHLSPELRYACLYCVNHVRESETRIVDEGPVSKFLLCHFLHWLEALSLMGRTRDMIGFIKVLQTLVDPDAGINTSKFLRDAKTFALTHATTIESWPLQTYSSALVFTPSDNIVRVHFQHSKPSWISSLPLVEDSWNPCKQVLEGHAGSVYIITFSHNSRLIASVSSNYTPTIWDVDTGRCVRQMTGHTGTITSVDFSHDSSLLLSASADNTIRIWHTETGNCIRVLDGHSGTLMTAVFSHDSILIASGSTDSVIRIWNVETGECKLEFLDHAPTLRFLAFSHDSKLIASADIPFDQSIRIWNTDSGTCKTTLTQKDGLTIHFAAFSHDSARLVVIDAYKVLRVWNVDTESYDREIQLDSDGRIVALSHDWKYSLSAKRDKISLWRMDTKQCVQTFNGHIGDVPVLFSSTVFSHDSTCFASCSVNNVVGIWDITEQDQQRPMIDPATIDRPLSNHWTTFSHDSSLVATTKNTDNRIVVWSAMTGRCIQRLKFPGHTIEDVVFSYDCSLVASVSSGSAPDTASVNGHVCIWEIESGACITEFSTGVGYRLRRVFSYDLKLLAIRSAEDTIDLWHVGSGVCVRRFEYGRFYDPLIFSHDAAFLAASAGIGIVTMWETETGELVYQHCMHNTLITVIALSHDLTLMAIATESRDIHIISCDNNECLWTFHVPGPVERLRFTYDASLLGVSLAWHGGVFIWRMDNGQLLHKMHNWSMNRHLKLETSAQLVYTNCSSNDQHWEFLQSKPRCCGYDLFTDGRWIVWGEHKLLRIPKTYETRIMESSDTIIVLGYDSGRYVILTTSTEHLSDLHPAS